MTDTDLLGNALTADEQELLDIHKRLTALAGKPDIPPAMKANVQQAMVMTWNACQDLLLTDERPTVD